MASIRRLSEGRYQITWLEGYVVGTDGQRRQRKRSKVVRGTLQDAKRQAAEIEARRLPASKLRDPLERTFGRVAAEWLERRREEVQKGQLEEKTWRGYEQALRKYALPKIGDIPLGRLEPTDVEGLYQGVPGASARILHAAVRQLLRWALRERWIGWDVAAMVVPPRHRPKKRTAIPLEHAARILATFEGSRWFSLITVALATGLREGELLGLRWLDVDWRQAALWIRQALKEPGSNPNFGSRKNDEPLAIAVHESVLEILREHKAAQDAERKDHTEDWGLVWTATDGSPLDPSNFRDKAWRPALDTMLPPGQRVTVPSSPEREHVTVFGDSLWRIAWLYGVPLKRLLAANPDVRLEPLPYVFHQLRHTFASHLLGGRDPLSLAAVAKSGGWSDLLTPLRHYAHAITEDDRRAAEKAAGLLAEALALGKQMSHYRGSREGSRGR